MAKEVKIRVRGVPRNEPDLRRLPRALLSEAANERRRQQAGEAGGGQPQNRATEAAS